MNIRRFMQIHEFAYSRICDYRLANERKVGAHTITFSNLAAGANSLQDRLTGYTSTVHFQALSASSRLSLEWLLL